MPHYLSVQYSAIQKTILRHDRLWSIAGISMILAELNEVTLPGILKSDEDKLVAVGGKFRAKFESEDAKKAQREIREILSTRLPIIEFQSEILEANQFRDAVKEINANLDAQKERFRGFGVSFNPHLRTCQECGEYPVIEKKEIKPPRGAEPEEVKKVCDICFKAYQTAYELRNSLEKDITTLKEIYNRYFDKYPDYKKKKIPYNFEHLFSKDDDRNPSEKDDKKNRKPEEGKRMAVWFSDLNNMGDKVKIWLKQDDGEIRKKFEQVTEINIEIVSEALKETFKDIPKGEYLPFRIIVAGGDDLCIVMDEKYILNFTLNISKHLHRIIESKEKEKDHPLNIKWLKDELEKKKKDDPDLKDKTIGPYRLGGSFIVTSIHTPFRKIHEVGEDLMKGSKDKTRKENVVNWRIMAEDEAMSDDLLTFDRPVHIENDKKQNGWNDLSFCDYIEMHKSYSEKISSSHRFQIISQMIEYRKKYEKEFQNDTNAEEKIASEVARELERWLMIHASSECEKSFSCILEDPRFRKNNRLIPERIATFFELLSIERAKT